MKLLTVVGARPQFIKAASVSRTIADQYEGQIDEIIVHTGQHFDANMSQLFFDQMRIPEPSYKLGISGSTHGAMTGEMLAEIETVALQEEPDGVLVYGDTNSTLAGALAASKLQIPVAHVEAGLRSFEMSMPEEVNRIITDQVSSLLFCPTKAATENLKKEGFESAYFQKRSGRQEIVLAGDVMYDACLYYKGIAKPSDQVQRIVKTNANNFILATIHRAENTDSKDSLDSLIQSLEGVSKEIPVVLPLHPRTKKALKQFGMECRLGYVIEPLGYFDILFLLEHCKLVVTDSGGLQKEAFFFGKPCLTVREQTEWIELVDLGVNFLVGTCKNRFTESFEKAAHIDKEAFGQRPYGDGKASHVIVKQIIQKLAL